MLSLLDDHRRTNFELGVARVLYFLTLLLTVNIDQLTRYSDTPANLICPENSGVGIVIWLTPVMAQILVVTFKFAACLSMIGLLTRVAMTTALVSFVILNLNALKFCYWNHQYMPLTLGILFWALLDKSSGMRVDDYIWGKKNPESGHEILVFSMRCYFAIVFFLSGVSKLKTGSDWITTDSLKNMLIVQNFAHENFWPSDLFVEINARLLAIDWLPKALAVFTILTELCAPLALFSRRLRPVIVVSLALLQFGIYVTMYINFAPWIALYIFWLPLGRIVPLISGIAMKLRNSAGISDVDHKM